MLKTNNFVFQVCVQVFASNRVLISLSFMKISLMESKWLLCWNNKNRINVVDITTILLWIFIFCCNKSN